MGCIRLALVAAAFGFTLTSAQYGTSSSSYGSPSSSVSYGSPSSASSMTSSASYPSINLPLISIPVTVGNASYGTVSANGTITATGTTSANATNFLATLPASAVGNLAAPAYANGVYYNDYDASRDFYYNHSLDNDIYALNIYTNPVLGIGGPLNLSNAAAVSVAQWWAPYPYRLAQWNDGFTTTQSSASSSASTVAGSASTAATGTATVATGSVVNASLYYAAYGGNIQNLGQPGLGIQVPGPAPTNYLTPSINYAFNVGSPSSAATSAPMSSSMGSSSYGSPSSASSYSSPSSGSSYGSTGTSSSGYGRRR